MPVIATPWGPTPENPGSIQAADGPGAGFAARYARARAIGYERLAEELLLISDDPCLGPDGYGQRRGPARPHADNRRWLLSKLLPRQFGDKIVQELVGAAISRSDQDRACPCRSGATAGRGAAGAG